MTPRIITVAAAKGGVGKTTLAYEMAAALGGVLVDLDWDAGGATRMWGFDPLKAARAPLLDALERGPEGRPPRLKRRANQPALVPAHPDLSASRIDSDLVADCVSAWAQQWQEPYVVVDTHPGANPLTDGAMQVADLVVVPVVLGAREMDALEAILADYADYRLLLVPTMVPAVPAAALRGATCRHGRRAPGGGAARLRAPLDPAPPAAGGARNPTQPGRAGARRGRRVPRGRRVGGGGLWLSKREST